MRALRRSLFAVLALAAGACQQPPAKVATRAPSPLPANGPVAGAPGTPWAKKTRAERMEFMGIHFFPKMKAIFRVHDPAGYAQFRCQTCHGEDMEAVDYRMPNVLYALPAKDPAAAALAADERTARFMIDTVSKAALELLGDDGRDACHRCHLTE